MANTRYEFLIVVGRMCGDDEDHARRYENMTRSEVVAKFVADVYEEEGYTLDDINRAEANGMGVFVNQVFASTAPILHL